LVLKRGRPVEAIPETPVPEWVRQTVRLKTVAASDLRVPWTGGAARVIGLVPGQIVTDSLVEELRGEDGIAAADPERDLAKIAVVERHLGTGRIGLGFVRGFGLSRGAVATTFSHDAHNLVVVGISDEEMARAIERAVEIGGGLVVVDGDDVTAELPLPVAGLLSDRPLQEVIAGTNAVVTAVHALGSDLDSPFQSLAFLALSVIPSLKITDWGLVDVGRFELVPLAAESFFSAN
nr:adenine deaminase [Actinomycetota bacterium]